MELVLDGYKYEITNWKDIISKLQDGIIFQLQTEWRKNISRFKLVDTGFLKESIRITKEEDGLSLIALAPYSAYIEYGTFEFWKKFGLNKFPENPIKKKDLSWSARQGLPKGMMPFAPMRRILYNKELMSKIVYNALSTALRTQ